MSLQLRDITLTYPDGGSRLPPWTTPTWTCPPVR